VEGERPAVLPRWFKGLDDRAVTRDLAWGVPVPLPDHEGKVLYVWFDAPIGYVSPRASGRGAGRSRAWRLWWQDEGTRLIHFIGKDNIVFHTLLFPAMLMAPQRAYMLPDNVPANEFLNLEGRKLSTSRGFAVWLPDYLEKFPGRPLRYTLARNLPETRDMNFTWARLPHPRRRRASLPAHQGSQSLLRRGRTVVDAQDRPSTLRDESLRVLSIRARALRLVVTVPAAHDADALGGARHGW
jgi:methionyl-tRNA synthetase